MLLDRNVNWDGLGKYALVLLRELSGCETNHMFGPRYTPSVMEALKTLEEVGALDWGKVGTDKEFFLIRLKDPGAEAALCAYAATFRNSDPEWMREVLGLADRAAQLRPTPPDAPRRIQNEAIHAQRTSNRAGRK